MDSIGNAIKTRRESLGVTIKALSIVTGLSGQTLLDIESDLILHPSEDALSRIAKAIGLDREALIAISKRLETIEFRRQLIAEHTTG